MVWTARITDSLWLRAIDRVASACNTLGVYMLVFVTAALSYEAIARYAFHAPTQWTQDVSTTLQVWFTYLGMALVLRQGQMIRITAVLAIAPRWLLYLLEALALLVVTGFSCVALLKGWDMLLDSIRLGRRQPTMLALPNWISEIPIVVGFGLLALQALAQLIRLPFGPPPSFQSDAEMPLAERPGAAASDEVRS